MFHSTSNERGFTLIELLVVIAIIGILASVVLASLNTARAKAANAAIKADLANIRAQAELLYDSGSPPQLTYAGLCTYATVPQAFSHISSLNGGTAATCNLGASSASYAIAGLLKQAEAANTYWCVDSSGSSKGLTGAPSGAVCQ